MTCTSRNLFQCVRLFKGEFNALFLLTGFDPFEKEGPEKSTSTSEKGQPY